MVDVSIRIGRQYAAEMARTGCHAVFITQIWRWRDTSPGKRIAVMYRDGLWSSAPDIIQHPSTPTRGALLSAIPRPNQLARAKKHLQKRGHTQPAQPAAGL
jgi:hypothetical protein